MCKAVQAFVNSIRETAEKNGDTNIIEFAEAMGNTKVILTEDQRNHAKTLCPGKSNCSNLTCEVK